MNKDQIMRALENASDEQLEQIAAIINTEPVQVPVTGRHVGCVIVGKDLYKGYQQAVLTAVSGEAFWTGIGNFGEVQFLNPYYVPITHRWSGGVQPVADDALVLVQYYTGEIDTGLASTLPVGWESQKIVGFTPLDVIGVEDE